MIEGDAKASAPTGTSCNSTSTDYEITGGSVLGDATACGRITSSVTGTPLAGVNTAAPPVIPLPAYTFDPANYPGINCYPSVPSCDETNTSATAVSTANVAIDAVRTNMSGDLGDLADLADAEHAASTSRTWCLPATRRS